MPGQNMRILLGVLHHYHLWSESHAGMVTFYLPNLTVLSQAGESQHKCLTDPSQWWYIPMHSKYSNTWKQGWLRMCRTSPSGALAHAQAQKEGRPSSLYSDFSGMSLWQHFQMSSSKLRVWSLGRMNSDVHDIPWYFIKSEICVWFCKEIKIK